MANQPAETMPGQNNMSGAGNGTYYSNQMQGAAQNPEYVSSALGKMGYADAAFTPGINLQSDSGGQFYQPGGGNIFGQGQQMVNQAYNPQMIDMQKQMMLQNARQANLMGLQGAQGQLAQMGMGTLGGQAGLLSGQYAQGAMNEAQAQLAGQQMAQMAAQGYQQAIAAQRANEMAMGDAITQAYGTAYDVVANSAPSGYKMSPRLEQDLTSYANLVGQAVMAGEMSPYEAQIAISTYPDKWAAKYGSKYERFETPEFDPSKYSAKAYTQKSAQQADAGNRPVGTEWYQL